MTNFRHFSRSVVTTCAVLIAVIAPVRAHAYTFNLVSDGSGQHLTWFWESCTANCTSSGSCGNVLSVNGEIPYSANGTGTNLAGGLLDWTATSGALSVVAVPTVASVVPGFFGNNCSGHWAAVDARETPLVFEVTPEAGDPLPLNATVQIRPRLVGSIEQLTSVDLTTGVGTHAQLWLQMISTVHVDGQLVSADSLMTFVARDDGADSLWTLSFPKGGANSVVVPGLTAGSEITLRIWAYMRAYVTNPVPGSASIYATSDYGQGPAVEVLIRDVNAVDVPPTLDPATLSLAARPNPSPRETRISYALPRAAPVRLSVYDLAGARVATLVDRAEGAGAREVTWNGHGRSGEQLAAGVYVVELIAGEQRTTKPLVLLGH